MERVNQGESLASWLNWLTEPLVVCWSVIMGDLLPSWKGVYWTLPEAFRTGPPSCAVHCMNGWLLANTGYNNRTTAHASANRRLVFGKWGLIYITIDFMVILHERQGVSNHRQIDRLPQQLIQPNVKGNNKGPHYWPFVRGIRRSPTDSLHKKASIVMGKAFPCHVFIMLGLQSKRQTERTLNMLDSIKPDMYVLLSAGLYDELSYRHRVTG